MKHDTHFQHLNMQELNAFETEFYIPFVKHFEGFNNSEIAHILQIPVETVKLRIKLARKVLGNHLESYQNHHKLSLNPSALS
jgi:hypothetical protein